MAMSMFGNGTFESEVIIYRIREVPIYNDLRSRM